MYKIRKLSRSPTPQAFLHWPEWGHMPMYEPITGQESIITMIGLKYSGFTLPIQWGWEGSQHSFKFMTTECLNNNRIGLMSKKGSDY